MPYLEKIPEGKFGLWQKKMPPLVHLDIELTERCNNRCIHCNINQPAGDTALQEKELPFEAIADILAQAAGLGCLTVRFTGGEPLLRDDFEKIYRYARKLGMRVILYTNGTRITRRIAKLFSEVPPLAPVEMTVYGMTQASSTAVTGNPDAFEKSKEGRFLLSQHNIPYTLKWVFLPPNRGEADAFSAMANAEGVDGPDFVTALDARARRDNEKKSQRIREIRLLPEERTRFLARDPDNYIKHMKAFLERNSVAPATGDLFVCGAGNTGCVDAYGKLQMCLSLRHPDTVYDLPTGNLKDALVQFFPEVRKTGSDNSLYQKTCGRCCLRGLCEQCPAKSWMEFGTLDTPVSYLCENAHVEARFLGLLGEGEKGWEVMDWKQRVVTIMNS